MRWQGMPIGGQSFNLTMRDADPNAFALIVFGFSDQVSAFGLLPFDLGLIGAPGCSLWISTDSSSLVAVDSGGNATFPIPVPASLGAFELFAEWAVLTAVNALGAVSTEAVRIRTR